MNHDQEQDATNGHVASRKRLLFVGALVVLGAIVYLLSKNWISFDYLATQEEALQNLRADHPMLVYGLAFLIYVAVTGLSLPGATVLTLVFAWYFGFWRTVVLVSFASTAGATLAFLLSRYLLRAVVQSRFGDQLDRFNRALDREGAFYLFTLRLIPAVPFFVINVVMGLTRLPVFTFWWVSQIGMLAGTCVYVYAGSSIPSLSQLSDPAQLRISDVADWSTFLAELDDVRQKDPRSSAARMWELVPPSVRKSHERALPRGRRFSRSEKMEIVSSINQAMARPDFALARPWSDSAQLQVDGQTATAQTKRLTQVNRAVLVLAFPDFIGTPQPILSKKVLGAFLLLGAFPIITKKLLDRFRNQRASP